MAEINEGYSCVRFQIWQSGREGMSRMLERA